MDLSDSQPTVAQVETDVFCNDCGFNLHTQRVWRDGQLGILVCRCPECGRHHPAGQAISATRPWLRRLGITLLIAWLLGMFAFTVVMGMVQFGLLVAHHENFVRYGQFTLDGIPVQTQFDGAGNVTYFIDGEPDAKVELTRSWVVPPGSFGTPHIGANEGPWIVMMLMLAYAATVVGQSAMLALGLWHRRSIWPWALALAALGLTTGLFLAMVWLDDYMRFTALWMSRWAMLYFGVGVVLLTATVLLARPIARMVLTVFLPLQACRTFSFLWSVDRKPLP